MPNSGLETLSSILLGMALGLMLAGVIDRIPAANSNAYKAKTALEKCEADLPRDQHCVVVAVPEKETINE